MHSVVSEPLTDRHHQLEQFSSGSMRSRSGSNGMLATPSPCAPHEPSSRMPGTILWSPTSASPPVTVLHRSFLAQVPDTVARGVEGSKQLRWSSDTLRASRILAEEVAVSVAQRVDGDHFELPADAVELLRQVRPDDRQRFIEEVTEALAVAADTKDFAQLQRVLAAWAATIRLQRRPGYEATISRMQRQERGVPVDLDELRHPRG